MWLHQHFSEFHERDGYYLFVNYCRVNVLFPMCYKVVVIFYDRVLACISVLSLHSGKRVFDVYICKKCWIQKVSCGMQNHFVIWAVFVVYHRAKKAGFLSWQFCLFVSGIMQNSMNEISEMDTKMSVWFYDDLHPRICVFRLHRMHEMQIIAMSVCLSVM